ncbi:MAG: hypothetical protein L6263_12660 [Desulfobacteraceae bacterium]|nr:hypothetical protein [Desulfobacteraceae bacterium]
MVLRCANVFRIALVTSVLVILFAGFASAADKIELRGEVYDGINVPNVVEGNDPSGNPVNLSWNAINFPGFGEDMKIGITGSERLLISQPLSDFNRFIPEQGLWYISDKYSRNFAVYDQKGLTVAGNANYSVFNFFGRRSVAIKDNSSKLARMVIEQNVNDIKNLTGGEVWDMGDGYLLKVAEINGTSARLVLSRNGIELDNKTVSPDSIYVTTKNIANETNVPIFVIYLDSIVMDGAYKASLKYTWLIVNEISGPTKPGDIEPIYRIMETWSIDSNRITLTNQIGITLAGDTAITLFGPPPPSPEGFKLKVADSNTLRFYPVIEITTPGIYEVRGKISESGSTRVWHAFNFGGIWYDFKANLDTELIEISPSESLTSLDRTIDKNNLNYSTSKVLRRYQVSRQLNLSVPNGLDCTSGYKTPNGGCYAIAGWQGRGYVAVNGKANKLAKLILEMCSAVDDKKTLTVGETWDMGDGYTLTANSIDAKATPRQVWLVFSKDGIKLEDKVVIQGQVYTYTARSIAGESDVPIFVTYIDSVFAGATTDMVQVRYTWLISSNVMEIRAGDVFGAMKVIEASENQVKLKNVDTVITLSSDSVVDIMGNLKFRVADNASVLRFYPFVTYEIPQPPLVLPPQPFDTLEFEPNVWNLVSVPKTLNNSAVDIVLNNLSLDANNVKWYYNASSNAWEHPSNIMPLRGYWVYSNVSSKIIQKLKYKNMAGPNVPPSMLMKAGWNLIGHTSTEAMQVKSALISIDGKYSHLLTYDLIKGWRFYIVGNPSLQQFDAFEPGRGYWIFMTQDATYAAVDV